MEAAAQGQPKSAGCERTSLPAPHNAPPPTGARFSSGTKHGSSTAVQPFWQALYDYGAELVMGGDDHLYERFAPQTPTGKADPASGIRHFTVGTGGRGHYKFGTALPNSQIRDNTAFGVLKLTLHPAGYDWEFVPEAGKNFSDAGSGTCHPRPNG